MENTPAEEQREKKNFKKMSLGGNIWENIKCTNNPIRRVPEGDERKRQKMYLKK